jgi:hypothetical protein
MYQSVVTFFEPLVESVWNIGQGAQTDKDKQAVKEMFSVSPLVNLFWGVKLMGSLQATGWDCARRTSERQSNHCDLTPNRISTNGSNLLVRRPQFSDRSGFRTNYPTYDTTSIPGTQSSECRLQGLSLRRSGCYELTYSTFTLQVNLAALKEFRRQLLDTCHQNTEELWILLAALVQVKDRPLFDRLTSSFREDHIDPKKVDLRGFKSMDLAKTLQEIDDADELWIGCSGALCPEGWV